jgi:hypothetical protein
MYENIAEEYKKMTTDRWEVQVERVFLRPEEEGLLRMEARMWT